MITMRIAACALAAASVPAVADAATVTRAYNFTGTNVQTVIGNAPPPFTTVNLSFRATFDPLVPVSNSLTHATLNGVNLPLGSPFAFSYIPNNNQRIAVGGLANGTFGTNVVNDDFTLDFSNALSNTPNLAVFLFTTSATPGSGFRAFNGQITSHALPEPASWALMILGFGMAGAALRRPVRMRRIPALRP